jgi:hypothetical protein
MREGRWWGFGYEGRFLCSDGSGGPLQRFGYGCCSFRRMEVYWHVAMGRSRPIEPKVELCTALDRVEEVSSCHMQVTLAYCSSWSSLAVLERQRAQEKDARKYRRFYDLHKTGLALSRRSSKCISRSLRRGSARSRKLCSQGAPSSQYGDFYGHLLRSGGAKKHTMTCLCLRSNPCHEGRRRRRPHQISQFVLGTFEITDSPFCPATEASVQLRHESQITGCHASNAPHSQACLLPQHHRRSR